MSRGREKGADKKGTSFCQAVAGEREREREREREKAEEEEEESLFGKEESAGRPH